MRAGVTNRLIELADRMFTHARTPLSDLTYEVENEAAN